MAKYRNDARIAAEEAALEAEEADFNKRFNPQPEDLEEKPVEKALTEEDGNWKQRYSDLRSHSQRQMNEVTAKIAQLEQTIAEKDRESRKLPTNTDEYKQWIKEYPDLARVLTTLVYEQTEDLREENKMTRSKLEEEAFALQKERAFNAVLKVHSDFAELLGDTKFIDWLNDQPNKRGRIGQALYDSIMKDIDPVAAIDTVNQFKADTKTKKPESVQNNAAFSVRKSTASSPAPSDGKKYFKESDIEAMDRWTFDKYEEEIELARREGRIEYDVSGAAR